MRSFHRLAEGIARWRGGWPAWALALLVVLAPACEQRIDTARQAPRKATLGDDIYGMMCDRLGAGALSEDLTGASYHTICHFDGQGHYGDSIDASVLPTPTGEVAIRARQLAVAKLERMASRRAELIRAFNTAFPDILIPNPTTETPDDTVRLHDALLRFSQDITKLYETNPYDSSAEPLMPMMTDALGRLFGALRDDEPARAALQRIAGRQGYRPFRVGLGAIRTMLSYPELRPLVTSQMDVLGPGGTAVPELQQMLGVVKRELLSSQPLVSLQPDYTVDVATAQPNRPRTALEVGAALLLDQHPDYAGVPAEPPRFVTLRDERGYAVPAGNTPGVAGTVPAPFYDGDGDGHADVDGLGRFVDAAGNAMALDTPFGIPGKPIGAVDAYGRSASGLYRYLDTSQTALGAVARDLVPLVDPNRYAAEGDPQPWLSDHETLMYSLAGMYLLAGPREPAQFDHTAEIIVPEGQACPVGSDPNPITGAPLPCTSYQRFVGEQSPLPDLVHAAGQILANPDSDVILLGLLELLEHHQQVVARVMGASLAIKAIADAHDEAAAQGTEEKAALAYEVPVWDQMAQVLSGMAQQPGLIVRLLQAMADPVMVQTHWQDPQITGPPAAHFGETLSAYMTMRDRFIYNQQDINGPAINLTDGYPSLANPHNPVDRNQPLSGDNRSMFERSAQLIYDGNRIKACNKEGAKVYTGIGNMYWPLIGSYTECELFTFDNIGAYYLDSTLPSNHPKRSELVIKSGTLQALLNFIGGFTSQDAFLESASGLDGMTLHPSAQALNRLLFYGAMSDQYGQMSDYDAVNAGSHTDKFVGGSIEPVAGVVCPPDGNGVRHCSDGAVQDVLRMRELGTIFGWERLGFYEYLQPQLAAFAAVGCNASVTQCNADDYTGESFFLDLVSTLWHHWPGQDHGSYCDSTSSDDPRYCSGAGINRYEPILGEAFKTDIIPALHEFAKVVTSVDITYQRGPKAGQTINGAEVIELLVKTLFDQSYAASVGMVDRQGHASTTWVDGTPQAQLTPYTMFAEALHRMDLAFDQSSDPTATDRKGKWRRARSQLVDQFLGVTGAGPSAEFANPSANRLLIAVLRVLREQLNANCPNRETSGSCDWARTDLGRKLSDTLSRPVFAALADLTEKISSNEPARRELERFLTYGMMSASSSDALQGMLASLCDLLQLLVADGDYAPIFNAVANLANPADDPAGAGAADRTIQVLKAMSDDRYDRYHVLDYVLPALVTPIDDGQGLTAVEVIVDAIADIHRTDATAESPLDSQDYMFVMKTLADFVTSEFRGFRQLYYIVQHRPKG